MRRGMRWEAPSMRTAAYDPGLLREQETPLVIEKNWFLDQEIPAGGYVRIQDSSQVWEERVDETRIITTEGLTTYKASIRRQVQYALPSSKNTDKPSV